MSTTTRLAPVIEDVPIEALRPDPANPRRIEEAELEALTRSLREFGMVSPIVARPDGTVIGGHQRLVAARRLGLDTVPVIRVDLPTEQARLLGLALNRIGGTWDPELLAHLLADLEARVEIDVSLSGFADDEIGGYLRQLEAREKRERPETFDLDEALEAATREPRTRPGDLWRLGEHRLLCGDATSQEDAARVLDGAQASMGFTDPPYNVSLGDHGGQTRARRRRIANDALDPVAWEGFVRAWAGTLLARVDGALDICMSSKELPLLSRVLAEQGGHWSDTLIWAKDRFTLGRSDYQRAYEPIWYGWRDGARHVWHGGRDQDDVWRIDRPTASPLHPTTKPLALVERAIGNSSDPGALVLDPFMGSGSTLIACERTGRRGAGSSSSLITAMSSWPAGRPSPDRPRSGPMAEPDRPAVDATRGPCGEVPTAVGHRCLSGPRRGRRGDGRADVARWASNGPRPAEVALVALTRRCQQTKADGSPCAAPPLRDRPYCSAHDPEHSDEMAEARRLGGLRRRRDKFVAGTYDVAGVDDVASIRRLLDIAALDTLRLENSNARSRTLVAIAIAATKLLEMEVMAPPPIVVEAEARAADEDDGD